MVKVIGAGHGRTGTSSLRIALTLLLGGPCYHMERIITEGGLDDARLWMAMADAKGHGETARVVSLARRALAGQDAAVDYPASIFYKELMLAFPDAKVILTTRDTAEWYQSVLETLWAIRVAQRGTWMIWLMPYCVRVNRFVDTVIWAGPHSLFRGRFADREAACAAHDAWCVEVTRHVPAERLLVYDVREGFSPLCRFLGVPDPRVPFPRVNEKARFARSIGIIQRADRVGKCVAASVLVGLVSLAWAFIRPRL
jgi:hypothetical protein